MSDTAAETPAYEAVTPTPIPQGHALNGNVDDAREETSINTIRRLIAEEEAETQPKETVEAKTEATEPLKEEGVIDETEVSIAKAIEAGNKATEAEKKAKELTEKPKEVIKEDGNEKEKEGSKEAETLLEEPGEKKFHQKEVAFATPDGKQVKVLNDAVIDVPVDGGIRRLFLQEVINRASGDIAVEERLKQVQSMRDKDRSEWNKKTAQIEEVNRKVSAANEDIKRVAELASSGKPDELLVFAAQKSGKDPKEVIRKFIQDTQEWAAKLGQMSQEQRDVWLNNIDVAIQKKKLEDERKQLDDERKRSKEQETLSSLDSFAQTQMQAVGVSKEEFATVAGVMREKELFQSEDLQERVHEVLNHVHEDRVLRAAKAVNPAFLKDQPLLQKVYDVTMALKARSYDKIERVMKELAGQRMKAEESRIASDLSRKVRSGGTIPEKKTVEASDNESPLTLKAWGQKRRGL